MPKLLFVLAAAIPAVVAAPSHATFAGRNGLLVFQRDVGTHAQLFTVRPDGSDMRQLTDWADSDSINAAWSPDGGKIAFVRVTKERGEAQRIYVMNADGSGKHVLDRRLRWTAAWLPGGRRLLVVRALKFVTVNADGTGLRDAGIPGGLADSPCVFGDGRRVAFLRSKTLGDATQRAIFVGRLGGRRGSLKRITPWQGIADKIDCSPDGSRIVFSTPNFGPSRSSNVYTVRTDGTGLRQLTHDRGGTVHNGADSWSPDGRKIAFASNRSGSFQIYTMNADGTGVVRITRGEAPSHAAAWGTHR